MTLIIVWCDVGRPLSCNASQLTPVIVDMMKLCSKFECNWAIRGGVITISIFDLMTLIKQVLCVALGSGIIFTKFHIQQLIRYWITAFFTALHVMQTRYCDENSVFPSVTRVDCDKTVERSVQIYIPYERTFSLVFWEESLVGGDPFYLKFWVNRPQLEQNRRFSTDNRS